MMKRTIIDICEMTSFVIVIMLGASALNVYLNKDAIIENVKSKVMESVLPGGLGGGVGGLVPDVGSPMADPSAPMPSGVGLGVPNF